MNEEEKIEIKKQVFQMLYDGTRDKFAVLPVISGLVIALLGLGVAGELIVINNSVRWIATSLILLMILSLQMYHSSTTSLIETAHKKLDELNGRPEEKMTLNFLESFIFLFTGKIMGKKQKGNFFERFSSQFPAYAILILWWVVFLIIIEIWS